jgi:peroxiredoxin Q/BCP
MEGESLRPKAELKEGDKAPDFGTTTSTGERVTLADLKGKYVVLFFYPKDHTPGCTKEVCAFRDEFQEISARGAVLLGVSVDSVKSHNRFIEKHKLPFPLLVDEDKKIVNAYGVYGEKRFMGIKYMGTSRVTFLIGPDGRIAKIWRQVKPATHGREVAQALGSAGDLQRQS